jgi:hypothetical protein
VFEAGFGVFFASPFFLGGGTIGFISNGFGNVFW